MRCAASGGLRNNDVRVESEVRTVRLDRANRQQYDRIRIDRLGNLAPGQGRKLASRLIQIGTHVNALSDNRPTPLHCFVSGKAEVQ
jgi:hypothetical protein